MKLNNKGFTLVETAVAFVLLFMVMGITMAMMGFGGRLVSRSAEMDSVKFIGDSVTNLITKNITYATNLSILPSGEKNTLGEAITVENGRLMYSPKDKPSINLYGDRYYGRKKIEYFAAVSNGGICVDIEVNVYSTFDDKIPAYKTGATIKLPNMGLGDNLIADSAKGGANPIITYNFDDIVSGFVTKDPIVVAMINNTQTIVNKYLELKKNFDEAKTYAEKQAAKQEIMEEFGSSNELLSDTHYYNYIKDDFYDDKWPLFNKERLNSLKGTGDAEKEKLYEALMKYDKLCIRPYYRMKNNMPNETIYYAIATNGEPWAACLVYNEGNNSWYAYMEKGQYGKFNKYNLSGYNKAPYDLTYLMNQLISGVSDQDGTWIKLN